MSLALYSHRNHRPKKHRQRWSWEIEDSTQRLVQYLKIFLQLVFQTMALEVGNYEDDY